MDQIQEIRQQLEEWYQKDLENWKFITIESFFESAPEGDFKWSDAEGRDWNPWYCDDCNTWHKSSYATEIGRKDGKRFIVRLQGDSDGDWQPDIGWEEGEDPTEFLSTVSRENANHFYQWALYWLDCAETGQDPLEEALRPPEDGFQEFAIQSAIDFMNYLKPKTWTCEKCGTEQEDNGSVLFCVNYPPTVSDPDKEYCLGKHPDYWDRTKDWPIRKRGWPRISRYLGSFD